VVVVCTSSSGFFRSRFAATHRRYKKSNPGFFGSDAELKAFVLLIEFAISGVLHRGADINFGV
jgi:hypothetical protein